MTHPTPLPPDTLAANLSSFLATTDGQTARHWYYNHSRRLSRLAERTGHDRTTAIGVFAALSPGTDVERNHALAEDMLLTGDCRHAYGDPIRKARRIYQGTPPSEVLRGPKVTAFYANLLRPRANTGFVTIDRHAIDILLASPTDDRTRKFIDRKGAYETCAQVYRDVADSNNILPHELQAIVWHHWRQRKQNGQL